MNRNDTQQCDDVIVFSKHTCNDRQRNSCCCWFFFKFQMSSPINYYFQFIFVSFSFFLFHCIIIFTHFKPIGNFSFDTCSFQSHFLFGLFFHERAIQSMEYQNGFCFCKKIIIVARVKISDSFEVVCLFVCFGFFCC